MKKPILLLCFFCSVCIAGKADNGTDIKLFYLENAYRNLWEHCNQFSNIIIDKYENMHIPYQSPNEYVKERKKLIYRFRKYHDSFKTPDEKKSEYDFCKNKLIASMQADSLNEEQIIFDATMYIRILPKDSIDRKAAILTNVLFPIYYERNNLAETYYICKLIDGYAKSDPDNRFLLHMNQWCFEMYSQLKNEIYSHDDNMEGMWISINDTNKKRRPRFTPSIILHVTRIGDEYMVRFDQSSNLFTKKGFNGSPCSKIEYDTVGKMHLSFNQNVFKEGISQQSVQSGGEIIGNIGKSVVDGVNSSNISTIGKSAISEGVSMLSGLLISALGNASANSITSRYMQMTLSSSKSPNILHAEYKLTEETRFSNNMIPKINRDYDRFDLYRIDPDSEIIFACGGRSKPVTHFSRLAYVGDEYYNVFKEYRKHVASYKIKCYMPWWITISFSPLIYMSIGHSNYNKRMYRRAQNSYSDEL